ncbi:MAG TPA: coenzyme F420-0:L-glutamate ligase [Actinomycetota bacterium]|jgi:F420-0:gamma-glutamyl ligase-like protein
MSSPGDASGLAPNEGKSLAIEVNGRVWDRLPIRTHLITADDDLTAVVRDATTPHRQPGDIIFLSERMVAVTQGRAYPIDEIQPSRLARFLVRFVYKSPYGIGLGSPWTMELALREVGRPRILAAAAAAAATKPFGVRGVFYKVAGRAAAAIDGPTENTIPPYNRCATLGPSKPNLVARALRDALGHEIVIIDANDLGVDVLGASSRAVGGRWAEQVFRDNPLGQSGQQTPVCLVRPG